MSSIPVPALLVMDMQEDLCRDARRRDLVDEMLPTLRLAVEKCLSRRVPVVFTQYWLPADDLQFQRFGDRYCIEGTPGAGIVSELTTYLRDVEIIRKRKHSAFFETPLEDFLRGMAVTDIGLAGLQTHICIMTTAADASFRGFAPTALSDCVVSSTATKKLAALDWIETYVGRVESSSDFLRRCLDPGIRPCNR
jgi:nicotinamidase-related amidase